LRQWWGLGIGAVGLGATRTINVGTISPGSSSALTVCTFDNSTNGIFLLGNISSTIEGNTFTDINVGTSPAWMNNYTGQCAIGSLGGNNLSILIDKNFFRGFVTGINVKNKRLSAIDITGNVFNAPGSATGITGIMMSKPNISIPFNNTINIAGNDINSVLRSGINITNETNALLDGNSVSLNYSPPARPVYGIWLQHCGNTIAKINDITNSSTPTGSYGGLYGIAADFGTGASITSNHLFQLGNGITFRNVQSQQTVQCNNIEDNWTGVWLSSSNIGNQLNNGTDQNNDWTLLGGGGALRGIVATGTHWRKSSDLCPTIIQAALSQ